MPTFILSTGLVLGSLACFCGPGQSAESSQPAPIEETTQSNPTGAYDLTHRDYGPFDTVTEAIKWRDHFRKKGHGANLVDWKMVYKGDPKKYYIRVFSGN